jgi:hypothetical protein
MRIIEFVEKILPWVTCLVLGLCAFVLLRSLGKRTGKVGEHLEISRRVAGKVADRNNDLEDIVDRTDTGIEEARARIDECFGLLEEIRKRKED